MLQFAVYDPVIKLRRGPILKKRFVGVMENTGDDLTFWILNGKAKAVIKRKLLVLFLCFVLLSWFQKQTSVKTSQRFVLKGK
jgi:hypothetical protein